MTNMQIAYWNLQELKRSNQARETETNRSNLVNEGENRRHNMQSEGIGWAQVGESSRHNKVMEAQGADQLLINASKVDYDYEVGSRNAAAREGELAVKQRETNIKQQEANTHRETLEETIRHNKKGESISTWGNIIQGANTLIDASESGSKKFANYGKGVEAFTRGARNIFDIVRHNSD